eukprot:15358703-Ditylum_brightwellii.AAC.1
MEQASAVTTYVPFDRRDGLSILMVTADIHKNNILPIKIDNNDDIPELVDHNNNIDSDASNFEDKYNGSSDKIKVKVPNLSSIDDFNTTRRKKMDRSKIDSVQWSEGKHWTKLLEALKMARILGGCQNVVSEVPMSTLFHYHKALENYFKIVLFHKTKHAMACQGKCALAPF